MELFELLEFVGFVEFPAFDEFVGFVGIATSFWGRTRNDKPGRACDDTFSSALRGAEGDEANSAGS